MSTPTAHDLLEEEEVSRLCSNEPAATAITDTVNEKSSTESAETRTESLREKDVIKGIMTGVEVNYTIGDSIFSLLITLLTNVWGFRLFDAVIITDIQEGAKEVLVIFVAWFQNSCAVGGRLSLPVGAWFYAIGLFMWFRIYNDYVKGFFFCGLVFTTVGQCVNLAHKKSDANTHQEEKTDEEQVGNKNHHKQENIRQRSIHRDSMCQWFSLLKKHQKFVKKALTKFSLNAIAYMVSTVLYANGEYGLFILVLMFLISSGLLTVKLYRYDFNSSRVSINFILSVLMDFFKKRNDKGHEASHQNLEHGNIVRKPQSWYTWCFFTSTSVTLSLVFLMYAVLTGARDTFFVEQIDKMDAHIGVHELGEVPSLIFLLVIDGTKNLVRYLCHRKLAKIVDTPQKRRFNILRVGWAMFVSIPCFVIAHVVERRRREGHDCILWLTPQLFLLGAMDGLALDGIKWLYKQELPDSLAKSYGSLLSEGIFGFGKILSVAWFCFWFYITKIGHKPGWFGIDIDTSHLDYYYVVMAVFGGFSLTTFACVEFAYLGKSSQVLPHQHDSAKLA